MKNKILVFLRLCYVELPYIMAVIVYGFINRCLNEK